MKRRGLKAYSGRQSWPISGQTDAPGIKVRLIGAIHIQTRSTSLTVHLARPAKLITVRARRRRILLFEQYSPFFSLPFSLLLFNFLFLIGRTLPREEGQAGLLLLLSPLLSRSWKTTKKFIGNSEWTLRIFEVREKTRCRIFRKYNSVNFRRKFEVKSRLIWKMGSRKRFLRFPELKSRVIPPISLHAGNGKCLSDEINSRCTNMGDVYELGISKFGLAMFN